MTFVASGLTPLCIEDAAAELSVDGEAELDESLEGKVLDHD